MASHQCGFFHASSNDVASWTSFHTESSWMVSHQCGFFHGSSKHLIGCICSHTGSSWMVSHQCGSFHGSSNEMLDWISFHTLNSWKAFHQYVLSYVFWNCLLKRISCCIEYIWMYFFHQYSPSWLPFLFWFQRLIAHWVCIWNVWTQTKIQLFVVQITLD